MTHKRNLSNKVEISLSVTNYFLRIRDVLKAT